MDEFEIDRIDILKMDCEGGERDFFLHVNRGIAIHRIRDFCGEYHYDIGMFWGETDANPFMKFRKQRLSIKPKH